MNYAAFTSHLWQSTLFALALAALTLAFRRHRAEVRYALWLAASLKFLVPFSLLTSLGKLFEGRAPAVLPVAQAMNQAASQLSSPIVHVNVLVLPQHSAINLLVPTLPLALWIAGVALVLGSWAFRWWRIHRAARTAEPLDFPAPLPVLATQGLMEPGVFGLFRPVLLLPQGIQSRLTPEQLQAILAHELCHVRRRDNLAAALHMLVEALFWFHPLVWWIGRRLVDERERACDEEVLRLGSEPEVYAESILHVCKFYLESPLPCTSGITGSDLKKRIETIMTQHLSLPLSLTRKLLLSGAALAAIGAPVFVGMLPAQTTAGDKTFEVVSIKPAAGDMHQVRLMLAPGGGLNISGMTLKQLMAIAYDVREFQIAGGPSWVNTERFDIAAKGTTGDQREFQKITEAERKQQRDQMNERLRNMLIERFQLQTHKEQKEASVYALVQGPNGHKLKAVDVSGAGARQSMRMGRGSLEAEEAAIEMLTQSISRSLGKPVLNKTGLMGSFNFKLEWTPDGSEPGPGSLPGGPPPSTGASGPSLFTAVQEQLGLKLESQKAPVDSVVIDKVEKPSAN